MLQGRAQNWSQLAGDSKSGRTAVSPLGEEASGGVEEADAGESIVGARVGIFWADDEIFYKVCFDTTLCYFRMPLHALTVDLALCD